MENVLWNFSLPIYPVHHAQIVRILLKYVLSCVDQFVPELNGLLVSCDKSTLRILTAHDCPNNRRSHQLLAPIRSELPTLFVRAKINVRLFSPKVGSELVTTVCAVQTNTVLCKTEVPNITVTLPRCRSTGLCNLYHSGVKKPDSHGGISLNLKDSVRVRLSAVSMQPSLIILRGEPIKLMPDPSESLVKKFLSSSSDEGDELPVNTGKTKRKKKFEKKQSSVDPVLSKSREIVSPVPCKSEPHVSVRKRPKIIDEASSLIKTEPPEEPRGKRRKRSVAEDCSSSPTQGLSSEFSNSLREELDNGDSHQSVSDSIVKSRKKSKKHISTEISMKIEPI